MARLFFALWPEEAVALELARLGATLATRCGGKPVQVEKVHLTLAFLGEVEEARVAQALSARVVGPAFDMRIDRIGAFRNARVAWADVSAPPPELLALQAALAQDLAERGFVLEDRAFTPHVTLARKVMRPLVPAAIAAVEWRARGVALMSSELGTGRYARIGAWELG